MNVFNNIILLNMYIIIFVEKKRRDENVNKRTN
jgi:hypothetical protein